MLKSNPISILTITAALICCVSLVAQTITPEPVLWLRSDNTGNNPYQWQDASGNNRHATGNSVINTSKKFINYNASADFSSIQESLTVKLNGIASDYVKVYTVFQNQEAETSEEFIWRFGNKTHHSLQLSNSKVYDAPKEYLYNGGQMKHPILSIVDKYKNNNPTSETSLYLGSSTQDSVLKGLFKGQIAEVLVFDHELTLEQHQSITSYLTMKYGITIFGDNYSDHKGKILRDTEENSDFVHNIFTLGRNDFYALNQKQATSASQGRLAISAGRFFSRNSHNPNQLQNGSYLFFADNGQAINQAVSVPAPTNGSYLVSKCAWKVNAVGKHTYRTALSLKLKVEEILKNTSGEIFLVKDKNKDGKFTDIEILNADSINLKNACFSGIKLCSNKKKVDYFTFAKASPLEAISTYQAPACSGTNGTMSIAVSGGTAPYNYSLLNANGDTIRTWQSNAANEQIDQLTEGEYYLSITDNKGFAYALETGDKLIAKMPDLNLKSVYSYQNKPVALSVCNLSALAIKSLVWEKDEQVISRKCKAELNQEGAYKLKMTTNQGCTLTHEFYLIKPSSGATSNSKESLTQNTIKIAPNPTQGKYNILFDLNKNSNVTIYLTNSYGGLVGKSELRNIQSQIVEKELYASGVYFVTILSENQILLNQKLVVE